MLFNIFDLKLNNEIIIKAEAKLDFLSEKTYLVRIIAIYILGRLLKSINF